MKQSSPIIWLISTVILIILLVFMGFFAIIALGKEEPKQDIEIKDAPIERVASVSAEIASPSATPTPRVKLLPAPKEKPEIKLVNEGRVTWYGSGDTECMGCRKRADGKFHTATGEVLDDNALTCASNIHRLGTQVKITHKGSGETVTCRVNDTGGFRYPTLLDVSKATAIALGGLHTHQVTIEVVK